MTGRVGSPEWMSRVVESFEAMPPEYFRTFAPPEQTRRRSAVLMLFGPDERGGESVVLTERAHTLRSHAGQVAFPGGMIDGHEEGPLGAALREAEEEANVRPESVEIVRALPELYITPSQSAVTPVLAWWPEPHPLGVVDEAEVARVLRAPLSVLTDPAHRFTAVHPRGYRAPAFDVDGLFVWGFTAMLLATLLELGGLAGEWDESVTKVVPDHMLAPEWRTGTVP